MSEMSKPLVYVAGPMSVEDAQLAVDVADYMLQMSMMPMLPHAHALLFGLASSKPHEVWAGLRLAMLERCGALLRIEGESECADVEVARAEELGLPVFTVRGWVAGRRALSVCENDQEFHAWIDALCWGELSGFRPNFFEK